MGWMEEEQKRMIADVVEKGKIRAKQKANAIRILGVAASLAVVVLIVGLFVRDKGARLPLDLHDPEGTVTSWKASGFVKEIDNTASTVVVDETVWNEISHDERTSIVAFLGSYCAEKRGTERAIISIKGYDSRLELGCIDSLGMRIN